MLALLWRKRHHEGEERKRRESLLECEEVERGRQKEAEWDKKKKKRERLSEKSRGVDHPLMAPAESRARALSPASVTVETAARISTSPGESKSPPGENEAREIRETKEQSISSPVPFRCQKSKEEEEGDREGVWGGVTVNGIESMTASSHSSVAPKHTAFLPSR